MKLSIEEILEKIEKLDSWELRNFIKSLDLTPEQMEFLVDHEDKNVRWGLAVNPNLTEEIMIKLTKDKDHVKVQLALNPNLTEEVMLKLSNDENNVRFWLAKNPKLTKELMIKLSSDENDSVKQWLAQNPNLTEEVMILLSSDRFRFVKKFAFSRLKSLNSLKLEDFQKGYDLINNSKHIGRENFEETFDYISNKFPELSKLAKMFKRIILKGKRDLK